MAAPLVFRERPEQHDKEQKAYNALERLIARVRQGDFTGTAGVELDVKQGGITTIRLLTKEIV